MADVQHTGSGDELLIAGEVARPLGVTVKWVYTQPRRHRIPAITLGRYRRYRRRAILKWLARLEDSENPEPGLATEPCARRVAAVVASG